MKRTIAVCLAFALCCDGLAASGQKNERALRLITLAPHLTELVLAVGAGDRLVGVSDAGSHASELGRLPVVLNHGRVNIEAVLRLKPDLVLAWQSGNRTADLEQLERHGVRVVRTEARRLEDVSALLRQIGELAGTQEQAATQAADFERRIAALRLRYAGRSSVTSFVEIWHAPLMSVNGEHVLSSVLAVCGGVNIFSDAQPLTPAVSAEQLYRAQPRAILSLAFGDTAKAREAWASLDKLSVVREGRIYALDADLLSRMTPQLAQGAEQLCAALDAARR